MIIDNQIRLYDKVIITKEYPEEEEIENFETFRNQQGTIIKINKDWTFPYEVHFDNKKVQEESQRNGGLLWSEDQIEFI